VYMNQAAENLVKNGNTVIETGRRW
jgi:hypothetical protein